jgi:hypothetical protein
LAERAQGEREAPIGGSDRRPAIGDAPGRLVLLCEPRLGLLRFELRHHVVNLGLVRRDACFEGGGRGLDCLCRRLRGRLSNDFHATLRQGLAQLSDFALLRFDLLLLYLDHALHLVEPLFNCGIVGKHGRRQHGEGRRTEQQLPDFHDSHPLF